MSSPAAISTSHLAHRYGDRTAIADLTLDVPTGGIFALLGPNGSGKTTLFRLLSTLIPLQRGEAQILGHDLRTAAATVRSQIGVVFQAPSVDKKLTVDENMRQQGRLYGMRGSELRSRIDEMLVRLRMEDRRRDLCETLSGGLRRRVELAQGLLHRPQILLLDEPSTGLDPGARSDLWQYFDELKEQGVTVVLTTHLLEEAERADQLAIMHEGKLVAHDTPAALQASLGGDTITIRTDDPTALAAAIGDQLQCTAMVVDGTVRLEQPDGHELIPRLMNTYEDRIESVTLGRPTLEDVFIARTGHRFWNEDPHD